MSLSMGESSERSGGSPGVFATTRWSMVLAVQDETSPRAQEALAQLCRTYWFPLYSYVRRQGHDVADAQDLTQEFFSRLLARNYLQMADRNRGRFRSFLLSSFKHMMANERRNASRQKRGGDAVIFSLDETEAEERYQLEPTDNATPDRLFERRWAQTTLQRVLDRLEAEYTGHTMRFDQLKVFLIEPKGAAGFADVAAALGVTESALKSVVHRMRRRYAELFRDEVAQIVAHPADIEDEIRHMLMVLAD